MTAQKHPVICLLGPTASGKTGLAVELRQRYRMDLISVDSALVYKRMDIGTAKPDTETLRVAPHALINIIEPWESYSVSQFLQDVNVEISASHNAGRIPVLVGGTMMYFHALWNGLSQLPPSDPQLRLRLEKQLSEAGAKALHQRLGKIDAASAARINENDPQRVLRALEVFELGGIPLSQLQKRRANNSHHDFFNIGLFPHNRTVLHSRIHQRFIQMLAIGFEDELRQLKQDSRIVASLPAMRCVGYRQMWAYLDNEVSRETMVERGVAASRQLAKRQLTWMRKMQDLTLFDIATGWEQLLETDSFNRWLNKY